MPDDERSAPGPERDHRTGRSGAAARMQHQASWVDQQIRIAMAKGEFDDLPGAGKPIEGLGSDHDPDWWLKRLIEREQITGVLPESVQLRKEDSDLDRRLDEHAVESEVRREIEEFNARVIRARYSLAQGPPLITMPRDVEETVAAWRERRQARRARLASRSQARADPGPTRPRRRWRRWWRRSGRPLSDPSYRSGRGAR